MSVTFRARERCVAASVGLGLSILAMIGCRTSTTSSPSLSRAPAAARGHRSPGRGRPRAEPIPLRIASWNVRRLGHGTKDLGAVAEVLQGFDVIAIQEVMTREVTEQLDARLPDHSVLLTDTPTPAQGSYREYFAFFYRPDRLSPTFSSYVPDPEQTFVRDPYVACFVAHPGDEELCLMTVHVVWGDRVDDRKREILGLDEALRWARDADHTSSWVVLGDFNRVIDDRDRDDEPEVEWHELLLPLGGPDTPLVDVGLNVPTTLGTDDYANAYDHIFVSPTLADRVGAVDRYDFVREQCAGDVARCKSSLSDHAPVYVVLE